VTWFMLTWHGIAITAAAVAVYCANKARLSAKRAEANLRLQIARHQEVLLRQIAEPPQ
jgi:hypothetical protein